MFSFGHVCVWDSTSHSICKNWKIHGSFSTSSCCCFLFDRVKLSSYWKRRVIRWYTYTHTFTYRTEWSTTIINCKRLIDILICYRLTKCRCHVRASHCFTSFCNLVQSLIEDFHQSFQKRIYPRVYPYCKTIWPLLAIRNWNIYFMFIFEHTRLQLPSKCTCKAVGTLNVLITIFYCCLFTQP